MLFEGSRIERVEIFGLGFAQYLNPVGMDEIEVSDHSLRRMRDRFIIETPVASVPSRFPSEIQFLAFFLEKLSGIDFGHLIEYLLIIRIGKNHELLPREFRNKFAVPEQKAVLSPYLIQTGSLPLLHLIVIQIALIRNSLNGIRALVFIFLLAADQLAIELINEIIYGSVHVGAVCLDKNII